MAITQSDINTALEELTNAHPSQFVTYTTDFKAELTDCGRFVIVWDGERWYADAETFVEQVNELTKGVKAGEFNRVLGDEPFNFHTNVFCQHVDGEVDADDIHPECAASAALTRAEADEFIHDSDCLEELAMRLQLLRDICKALGDTKLDELVDLSELPTFEGDTLAPVDTQGIFSWSDTELMVQLDGRFEVIDRS